MEIRPEDEKYVRSCLAKVNRDWIEPFFAAQKERYDDGYTRGMGDGYAAGIKENKIILNVAQ